MTDSLRASTQRLAAVSIVLDALDGIQTDVAAVLRARAGVYRWDLTDSQLDTIARLAASAARPHVSKAVDEVQRVASRLGDVVEITPSDVVEK